MAKTPAHPSTTANALLAGLSPDVLAALLPKFSRVSLSNRQVLYAQDEAIDAVFFVESGMASMVAQMADGQLAEVGVIGNEGMVGLPLILGVETTFTENLIQLPGTALRMSAVSFRQELASNEPLRARLLRYADAQHTQISQTAACNSRHDLEERFARWLLMAHDRVEEDELPLTQEFMAMMLGVHRPSITVTAGILQRAGLIRYAGGRITILDRCSLEAASCECYQAVRRRFERVLGRPGS